MRALQSWVRNFRIQGIFLITFCWFQPGYAAEAELIEEVLVSGSIADDLGESGSFGRVTEADLKLIGATHPAQALNRIPGVWINEGSGQEHLTAIRSPVLTGSGACGEFAYLEDGLPIRPQGFCNINNLFELNTEQAAALEVWRGPAGAVLGGNAMRGTINAITPVFDDQRVGLEVGPYGFHRVQWQGGRDLDSSQIGGSVVSANTGGYRDDTGYGQQKVYAYYLTDVNEWSVKTHATATLLNQETGAYVRGFEVYKDDELRQSNPSPEAYRDAWSLRIASEWTRDSWTIKPYFRRSGMTFLQHFLPGRPLEKNQQSSRGILLTHDHSGDRYQRTIGAQVETMSGSLNEFQAGPTVGSAYLVATRPSGLHYDYAVDSQLFAVFYNISYGVGERLNFIHSLRVEQLGYEYDNHHLVGNTKDDGTACARGGCLYTRPADRDDNFSNMALRFGFEYDVANGMVYGSLSTGFRPPQVTELYRLRGGQTVADLDSERLTAVELGLQQGAYSVAAFADRTRNYMFRDSEAYNVSNGKIKSRGIEASGQWQWGNHQIGLAATYASHQYDFDRDADGREKIRAGNDMDSAPKFLANVTWRTQLSDTVAHELEIERVGSYYLDAANTAEYDGHYAAHWRLQWQASATVQGFFRIRNVLDTEYATRADYAFGSHRYFPALPRQIYLGVTARL